MASSTVYNVRMSSEVTSRRDVVLRTEGLIKRFGSAVALDGLDLEVRAGEVHAFLGPNGAGKTTAIRILLGLLRKDACRAVLLGGDPWRDAVALHRRLAYVPGDVTLWPGLSGGEIIDLLGRLRGGLDPGRRRAADRPVPAGSGEEGPRLLHGQPAEGGADRRAGQRRRAAAARRADRRPGPADGSRLPGLRDRGTRTAGARCCCPATSWPRPRRWRTGSRSSATAARSQTGTLAQLRHLTRTSVDAELACPVRLGDLPGVHDLVTDGLRVRCEVDQVALDEVLGRLHQAGVGPSPAGRRPWRNSSCAIILPNGTWPEPRGDRIR